ncbi:FadR/GntR family transcriptional regulator [Microbacterium sp. SS28]|uniref:FadR/GntR family transcriptional regulator n=1 Tax=Microbacterium sp. SS28 TaxID=2919948 RepID=UPI001FAB293E|nr:GntR family transcriptional regulator [Microbacterium sp. SS28]
MADDVAPAPARAWRVVLEKIESDLLEGRLNPGERLPPERELAATLGVGRSSVREALRVLEVMGLIRTGTGSGPTSGAIIVSTPRGGLAALLRLQVAAQGFPLADVVATRLLLEEWVVARLAVESAHDLADARATLTAMDDTSLNAEEFIALDAQFHLALAEASGNAVVSASMGGLRTAIESYVQKGARTIPDWDAAVARLRSEHNHLMTAIDAGEVDLARSLVHDHIAGFYAAAGLTRD